jgi:voltage-gated potassium channel
MKVFLNKEKDIRLSGLVLLISVIFLVFIGPLLPIHVQKVVNSSSFSIIFLAAALSLNKYRNEIFYLAIGAISLDWLSEYIHSTTLMVLSDLINFIFFVIVVMRFIAQLVKSKKIGWLQIYEAINGYLLLGIIFSILIAVTYRNFEGAFYFPQQPKSFGDLLYYGFVTLSTLGYGDIVPKLPVAKSLALMTTIAGQFYIATIIAIIISKYQPGSQSKSDQ